MFTYQIDEEISLALPRPKLDAQPLFELVDESRSELAPWLPWVPQMQAAADEEAFLTTVVQHFATGESLNVVILYQGQTAGMISFNRFNPLAQSTEIGYWLGTKYSHKNIMHRAVAGMCAIGFQDYQVNKIVIEAAVENAPSNQVAKKAGFHLDGTMRANELLADGYHDGNVWSLLRSDWEKREEKR